MAGRNNPHEWEVKMEFRDKRFAIWGFSGFITWAVFIVQGSHHNHTMLQALGVALIWGTVSVLSIASVIRIKEKK
jgi:hypothetical protein